MKRTCKRCRALREATVAINIYPYKIIKAFMCNLGYEVKSQYCLGIEVYPIPLEECPKPLTHKEYWLQKKQAEGGIKSKCLSLS